MRHSFYILIVVLVAVFMASCSSDPTPGNGVRYDLFDVTIDTDSITVPRTYVAVSSKEITVFRDSMNSPIHFVIPIRDVNIWASGLRFSKKDINFYQTDRDLYIYTKQYYTGLYIIAFFGVVFWAVVLYLLFVFIPFGLWYQAFLSGVRISPHKLIYTKLKNVPIPLILNTMITAQKSNLKLGLSELETVYLAKVDVEESVQLEIEAENAGFHISLLELLKYYLAKVNVKEVVHALIHGKNAGVELTLAELAEHYLAKVKINELVNALIIAKESGIKVSKQELVTHQLAGGNIKSVVNAVVAAKNADEKLEDEYKLNLSFKVAKNIDLAGINILEAVKDAIEFKVITVEGIDAVALDGVRLTMRAEVTIRPIVNMIIEAAGEKTVVAQVVEGIASEIGSTISHFKILENPFVIAENVLKKEAVGKGTAYRIMSIDISNIEIGHDIHAELQIERAKAEAESAKAELIKADEKVKKAMAAAFFDGKLTIQQYYNLENMESDTMMRRSFSKPPVTDPKDHPKSH